MRKTFQNNIGLAIFMLVGIQLANAQKKEENIGTEVVNVVKPYSPTISDAFKVKETPNLDDDETAKKENIQYNIFSFPVASTFAPSKGRAAGVEKSPQEKLFNNYATLGFGNYGTINAELFVTENINNDEYVSGMFRHLSSQGGIKNVELNDKFYDTSLDLTYGNKSRNVSWNSDFGYHNQIYNWYGLQSEIFTSEMINSIDEQQTYHTAYLGGNISLADSFFKDASIKYIRFWDALKSGENRFYVKPNLLFEMAGTKFNTEMVFDFVNGNFDKDYVGVNSIKYGFANIGIKPSFKINQDDLSVNLGVGLFYSADTESKTNRFFIYPQITASYRMVGDLMIAYGGAEGNLKQNSYNDFVQENFFVSPTLNVSPTDQKFDIYIGLKGKLANSLGYNIKGAYLNEGNRALFKNNELVFMNQNEQGYAYGNSFRVVTDNLQTLSLFGELKADLSKNVSFGVNGTVNSYSTSNEKEAWNLPTIKMGANLDVNITSKWFANTNLFFVGERKDQFVDSGFTTNVNDITLKSYFDINAHVGYKHDDRLTFFLKGNNLANQEYQRWLNYPVQGIQGMLGANYKFDF